MLSVLLIALLLAGWVAAWINWLFNGEIRQFIVSLLPASWRGHTPRVDVLHMTSDEITTFVCATGGMPEFLRGILSCPLCMSAHVAGAGTILAARPIYVLSGGLWELIPLVWAAGAVVGFISIKRHL